MTIDTKTDGNLTSEDIKSLRLSLGYSQQHFAEVIGVCKDTIRKWEKDIAKPLPVFQQRLRNLQKKVQSEVKHE